MTATTTALVPLQPAFSDAERLALAGFLAGYRGLTREAYALDPMPSPWTATSLAPFWSPPGSARRSSTR